MTHKNPELRASSVVKDVKPKAAVTPARKFGAEAKVRTRSAFVGGLGLAFETQRKLASTAVVLRLVVLWRLTSVIVWRLTSVVL